MLFDKEPGTKPKLKFKIMKTMIKYLRNELNYSNDLIYETLVGFYGLYHIAFFGHKGTKQEKAKLNYIWKVILKTE